MVVSLVLKVGLVREPASDYFLPGFAIIQTLPNSPFTQEPFEIKLSFSSFLVRWREYTESRHRN